MSHPKETETTRKPNWALILSELSGWFSRCLLEGIIIATIINQWGTK